MLLKEFGTIWSSGTARAHDIVEIVFAIFAVFE